jgi:hypothetical protein
LVSSLVIQPRCLDAALRHAAALGKHDPQVAQRASPWSAALRYHRAAFTSLCATPWPLEK